MVLTESWGFRKRSAVHCHHGPNRRDGFKWLLGGIPRGNRLSLAFLGALITIALVSYSFMEFSRHYAHAGSVYAFNGHGLGARFGFLSGCLLVSYTQSERFGLAPDGVKAFATPTAPLAILAQTYVGSAMAAVIMFGATIRR